MNFGFKISQNFYRKISSNFDFAFYPFILKEFVELVEKFYAKINNTIK